MCLVSGTWWFVCWGFNFLWSLGVVVFSSTRLPALDYSSSSYFWVFIYHRESFASTDRISPTAIRFPLLEEKRKGRNYFLSRFLSIFVCFMDIHFDSNNNNNDNNNNK
jgi:hypothetical protein